MFRLKDERGAVSILVALLMVMLLGFAAIAVDVSAAYAKKQRLQNGVDAAALSVAQDCATGVCGTPQVTAQSLVAANLAGSVATVLAPTFSSNPNRVTVSGSTVNNDVFAPVLGITTTTVNATATVGWGQPVGGTAVLPLAFSWCAFKIQTGGGLPSGTTARTIYFSKTDGTSCTGPSGNAVPGGFAWLAANSGTCQATSSTSIGQTPSDPGNSIPSSCSTGDISSQLNKTVLLPLYDDTGSTGSGAWYHIYGYVAFRLTGYSFGGQFNSPTAPCSGNDRCVSGYFTQFVDLSTAFTYGVGPTLGLSIVFLTH